MPSVARLGRLRIQRIDPQTERIGSTDRVYGVDDSLRDDLTMVVIPGTVLRKAQSVEAFCQGDEKAERAKTTQIPKLEPRPFSGIDRLLLGMWYNSTSRYGSIVEWWSLCLAGPLKFPACSAEHNGDDGPNGPDSDGRTAQDEWEPDGEREHAPDSVGLELQR